MKIFVLGTRGIPDIMGGVETHCEELYPRIVEMGYDVTLITRSPYVKDKSLKSHKGVKLKHLYSPRKKAFEAIIHSFLGVIYSAYKRPDILHIHAVGPMLMTPLARLLGLKVVVTNHGPDYDRQKWSKIAKKILQLGEYLGTKTANQVIVISDVINNILKQKYNRNNANLIYNGVTIPNITKNKDYILSLGLDSKHYIIAVGRFVEEKGFSDLIQAYASLSTNLKLVLVGDADHATYYSVQLKKEANKAGVILTGFIKGEKLNQIFSHAKLFVMPSYHEGLPIALLEALSYNLDVLVSNIPANLEVGLAKDNYFEVGNIKKLSLKMTEHISKTVKKYNYLEKIEKDYNWATIASQTYNIYNKV